MLGRSLVVDGEYIATLRPPNSDSVPFVQDRGPGRKRINFEAVVQRAWNVDQPDEIDGIAYGNLESFCRYPFEGTSSLTWFLKKFFRYRPPMTLAQRLQAVIEFIQTEPTVLVTTTWVGYSHRQQRTVAHSMAAFPIGPGGTHVPVMLLDGEVISAKARIYEWRPFRATAPVQR